MSRILSFFLVAIFSLFLGSQITEGCLLLPYWKTLSTTEFYYYYAQFGKEIGRFYTILTVIAALIPLSTSIYCILKKSPALRNSLISSFFTFLFIAVFYLYFKGANQQFYNTSLSGSEVTSQLVIWGHWHWFRVFLEFLALVFLILTFHVLTKSEDEQ